MIGPGSEWFWAAAQFFVVVITLVGLYRQLRTQNAANVVQRMESLQGAWDAPRLVYARLAVMRWLRDHPGEAPGYEDQAALAWVCNFFENLHDLAADGYLTWNEIEYTWGQPLVAYWDLLGPTIAGERAASPLTYKGFEKLANRAAAVAAGRGEDWTVGRDDRVAFIDGQIGRNTARLRILNALSRGEIPVEPSGDAAEPAPTGSHPGA